MGIVDATGKELVKYNYQEVTPVPKLNAIRMMRNKLGDRLYFPKENAFLELSLWLDYTQGPFRILKGTVDAPKEYAPDELVGGLSFGEVMGYDKNYGQRKAVYNRLGGNRQFRYTYDLNGNFMGDNLTIKPLGDKWVLAGGSAPWTVYDGSGNVLKETALRGGEIIDSSEGWISDAKRVVFPDLSEYNIKMCSPKFLFVDKDGKGSWVPMINGVAKFDAIPYDEVVAYSGTSAFVKRDGKWGLYEEGSELLAPKYNEIKALEKLPYAEVRDGEYVGLYMPSGRKWILPLSDKVQRYEFYASGDRRFILIYNGKWGLADLDGKIIKPMASSKDAIMDSLKPKEKKADAPRRSSQPKQSGKEKPKKKSNTDFQESKTKRPF